MFSSSRTSNNYERLEGGPSPTASPQINGSSKRVGSRMGLAWNGWKRFFLGAAVIIGLVWYFGPNRDDMVKMGQYIPNIPLINRPTLIGPTTATSPITDVSIPYTYPPPHFPSTLPPGKSGNAHPNSNDVDDPPINSSPHIPTSVSTDPDLTKTVHCTHPHDPSKPLVQYALMIDAGSTGSRIHIYKFHNCGPSPEYEYEVFKQTHPGLSSYKGRPVDAAKSLDVLLDEAMRVIPPSLQKCTPVAVKATAGLRLLGKDESEEILEAVKKRLHERYPFNLQDKDGVVIMDGKDEGVYAWITANYLLKTIRSTPDSSTPPPTPYAVLDLGGASTQIVFEPTFDMSKPDNTLKDGEHKYDLEFGGKKRVLYQHSYLGYGLMRARASVHKLVEFMATTFHPSIGQNGDPGSTGMPMIGNPCLARGTSRVVEVEDERVGEKRNVTMIGADIGGFEACNRVIELVMAKDAICEVKPCSFNGVYQPSLLETFPTGNILLLSYFYDRIRPLLPSTLPAPPIFISTISSLAQQVCLGRPEWEKHWGDNVGLMKELEGRPEWCLDMTFMHALLRLGYEFGDERVVEIGKQVQGTELGWCLGATIAMVGADLKCRV